MVLAERNERFSREMAERRRTRPRALLYPFPAAIAEFLKRD